MRFNVRFLLLYLVPYVALCAWLWSAQLPDLDPLVNVVLIGVATLTWLMLAIMHSARIK